MLSTPEETDGVIKTLWVYSVPDVSKKDAVADNVVGVNVGNPDGLLVFKFDDINEPPPKPSVTSNNAIVSKTLSSDESLNSNIRVPLIASGPIVGLYSSPVIPLIDAFNNDESSL